MNRRTTLIISFIIILVIGISGIALVEYNSDIVLKTKNVGIALGVISLILMSVWVAILVGGRITSIDDEYINSLIEGQNWLAQNMY